jgi:excinuclease ABC subunit C
MDLIAKKLAHLPKKPGAYIFKDSSGLILYVGKAINLRFRVSSYFKKDAGAGQPHTLHMIPKIKDLDYIITDNEVESLILENNLIKQLKPKYNVRLRDDKNYLFIKLNLKNEIPTIGYERQASDKAAKYLGPYTSAQAVRETLRMVRNIFPYCANSKVGEKPCFYYHIRKCPGVCVGKVSLEEYRESFKKIIAFLEGRHTDVLKQLQGQMNYLSRHSQFEKAAKARDQIFALNRTMERQKVVSAKNVDQDVFSAFKNSATAVNLFIVRKGKLIQREQFLLENTKEVPQSEALKAFLSRYYVEASSLPKEIVLPEKINSEPLEKFFFERTGRKLKVTVPSRGPKRKLISLGEENARQFLEAQSDKPMLAEARLLSALKELRRILKLKNLPARIEAYDISNIQGQNPSGSMIVFGFGKPDRASYRKFRVKHLEGPNDYKMMKEVLERRFARSLNLNSQGKEKWPLPDLILVDGGKGQLSVALSVLSKRSLDIPAVGLAKRLEEIFIAKQKDPLVLPRNSIALYLLQRIRDEAHRFAKSYHKYLRSKSLLRSALDSIEGIGPKKKQKLMEKFGSAQGIREASLTDIAQVVGSRLAEKIKARV